MTQKIEGFTPEELLARDLYADNERLRATVEQLERAASRVLSAAPAATGAFAESLHALAAALNDGGGE